MRSRSVPFRLRSAFAPFLVSARTAGLVLGLSVLAAGCGASRPYYAGFRFDSPTLVETDRSDMVLYLDWVIKSQRLQRITLVTPDKGTQSLLPRDASSPDTTDWLPLPALFAASYILSPKFRGLEIDLLTRTEAEGYTPVTAMHDLDGSVRIEMGPPIKDLVPQAEAIVTREELTRRFAIGAVRDSERAWLPLELYSLSQALGLLSEAELVPIRGVPFVRRAQPGGSGGRASRRLWGQYLGVFDTDPRIEAREILLFDTEPGHDTSLFIGEPTRFFPIPTMCLLHEIGHAIVDYARNHLVRTRSRLSDEYKRLTAEQRALRELGPANPERAAWLDKRIAAIEAEVEQLMPIYRAARDQYRRDGGPVLAAYRAARGPDKGPTPYGRTSLGESFAESFALYKADPGALRRVYPGLYEWFATGQHIQALQTALGPEWRGAAAVEQTATAAAPAPSGSAGPAL